MAKPGKGGIGTQEFKLLSRIQTGPRVLSFLTKELLDENNAQPPYMNKAGIYAASPSHSIVRRRDTENTKTSKTHVCE